MVVEQTTWLEGGLAVQAALEANSREVYRLVVSAERFDGRVAGLQTTAAARGIPAARLSPDALAEEVGFAPVGGLAALVGPRRTVALETLVAGQDPCLVMLDGVEDPYNYGQALRALYAAGITGAVARPRNWLDAGPVIRASAGASELMPIALADSPEAAAQVARAQGLAVVCAAQEGALSMHTADLRQPLLLVVGGEKRGVTRSFLEQADLLVSIPYGRAFEQALGAAGAATVLAFEIMRQRGERS